MLTVKAIAELTKGAVEIPARTVIIEDSFGNPLVVVCEVAEQTTVVVKGEDPSFDRVLHGLGIDKIVVDTRITLDEDQVPEGAKLLLGPGV